MPEYVPYVQLSSAIRAHIRPHMWFTMATVRSGNNCVLSITVFLSKSITKMSQQCKFKNIVSQRVIVFCMLLYSHDHRLLPTLVKKFKKNRTLTLNDSIIAISFESEKFDFMTVQICLNVQSLNEDFTGYQSHYPLSGGRYDCDFKSVISLSKCHIWI